MRWQRGLALVHHHLIVVQVRADLCRREQKRGKKKRVNGRGRRAVRWDGGEGGGVLIPR